MAAAAVGWRSVSRWIHGSSRTTSLKAYSNAPYTRKLSATSSSDISSDVEKDNEAGGGGTGIPSFSDLKQSLEPSKSTTIHHQSEQEEEDPKTKNNISHFQDVKASLRNPIPQRRRPQPLSQTLLGQSTNFDDHVVFPDHKPSVASLDEIRKNLSEFRMKSAAPTTFQKSPPNISSSSDHAAGVSFQALYESSVGNKSNINRQQQEGKERLSFQAIRESLQQLRSNKAKESNESLGSFSLKSFGESLRLQPGGGGAAPPPSSLPSSVFGREMREKAGGYSQSAAAKTEFMKMYSYDDLGEKLRKLRPDVQHEERKGLGFSLSELNERLQKLREIEEKETESKIGGISFKDLRESLVQLRVTTESSNKKSSLQRLALLGQLGGQATPNFMLQPPKDHLIEQYFHPDNMSSAEKLKLELKKVREKFRMNEADCGSSRVQVARLTTKINHLSQLLHKKDKHSRKGLEAMVQRRKKLLKYLRRTDWDSYCFLLSKLGLRDNPDYKT